MPFLSAFISGFVISSLFASPLYFSDLIVLTSTTALGLISATLHFISKNFSAPSSEPKPASVMT